MTENSIETLIVGGGLAGLHCAYQLAQAGRTALLLEAKPRLGGRILSTDTTTQVSHDLGPTWFWPHQHQLIQLLESLDVPYFEQHTQGDVLYQLHSNHPATKVTDGEDMQSFRIRGGMQRLLDSLIQSIPASHLQCSTQVTLIERKGDLWRVEATNGQKAQAWQAKHLVLALPPRIIARDGNVQQWASPALQQTLSMQQTWMSGQAKFLATYKHPFWRENGLSGTAFSRVGPMQQISDASAGENDHFALFGFVGVPPHMRVQLGQQALQDACLDQLAQLFGEQALAHSGVYLKDWALDERVATETDIREPSRHAHVPMLHFESELDNLNLHLAGSEFAAREAGYLEGALLASQVAVECILAETL